MATDMENTQLEKERVIYLLPILIISVSAVFPVITGKPLMPMTWLAVPLFFGYVGEALLACTPTKFNN